MVGDWIIACRRIIIRVAVRRRSGPPHIYRFHADRWHTFRVYVAAFGMHTQPLDSKVMAYENQPTMLALRSSVEGVTYYAPRTGTDVPPRKLRPLEVTDEVIWPGNDQPTIVITNPTARDAHVDVVYAVRDEGDPIAGGGGGGNLF